jgi:hypothetical protein
MQVAVLGIDLGKNICSVVGLNGEGRVILRRRMRRDGVVKLASGLTFPRFGGHGFDLTRPLRSVPCGLA